MSFFKQIGDQIIGVYKKVEIWIFLFIFIWVAYHFTNALLIYKNTGKWPENFVSSKERLINDNVFQEITLPKYTDYDIEMAIPSGQLLHNTVQGNWGLSTDSYNKGATLGIYRDGYSADGAIYKGTSGKSYKRMLEQGPYTLKYSFRKGEKGQDVKIFVNDNMIHDLKNEGVTSDKFKVVGTNYASFNKETTSKDRGRRKIDYIKFIPMINQEKESFSNMNIYNIEQFLVREHFQSTISKQMQEKNSERIKEYLNGIKEIQGDVQKEYQNNIKFLMENRWRGYKYAVSPAFYQMHNDIANGMSYDVIVNKYKHIIHDKKLLLDGKKGGNYFNKRLRSRVVGHILRDLGDHSRPMNKKKLAKMMEKSIAKIKSITFTEKDSVFSNEEEETEFRNLKQNNIFDKPLWKQISEREKQATKKKLNQQEQKAGNMIMPGGDSQTGSVGYCPKNCVKTTLIDGNCEKDIIRMVVDGKDKFYRKCPYRCKNRAEEDYINHDQSGPGRPYNLKRDGCRYSQAQCSDNCSKTLVEVDEEGRDLNQLPNNYATANQNSSKMFAKKQTTGLFGVKDNRLGGSKQAYRTDYKPQDPNPKIGPINYDSIWDFKA